MLRSQSLSVLCLVLIGALACPVAAATAADNDERDATQPPAVGPRVGGRLAHVDGETLDLLGDVWADLPLVSLGRGNVFTTWVGRSAITDTTDDFAFTVRDLEYRLDLGWRWHLWRRGALAFSAGQRGRTDVDQRGEAWVRAATVEFSSRDFGRSGEAGSPVERFSFRLGAGAVLEEHNVRADAVVQGAARARFFGERLSLDLELDGLVDGGRADLDVTFGPSFAFFAREGRRMSLFLHYLDADNPLGTRADAWLGGFQFEEGPPGYVQAGRPSGADVSGTLALGAGEDSRESAQLRLHFVTPELFPEHRIAFDLDTHVLTGADTDELYYLYHVGLERVLRYRQGGRDVRGIVGGYFYHRSNHQLDRAGQVTSINVAEVGVETPRWHARGPRRQTGRLGAIDARLRVGYLLDSDFGLDQRWHVRAGLRWQVPLSGPAVPFVRGEAELGDVNRRAVAVGVFVRTFEFQVERRTDDQYFGVEREVTLLTAGYAF